MKNNILSLLAVCVVFFGCQKKEIAEPLSYGDDLHATFEDATSTKTVIDENKNIRWSEGDQIVAFMKSSIGLKYQIKPSYVGKTSGYFSKVSSDSSDDLGAGMELDHNVVYYPYSESVECYKAEDGCSLYVTLPSIQTYAPDSFGNGFFPMVAISETNEITFRNVCGALKFSLKGTAKVKTIALRGNADELLSGNAIVSVSSDGRLPSLSMSMGASKAVTLDCGSGVQLNEETATVFLIALPPTSFAGGFTATITDVDGGTAVLTTTKANPIERSVITSMPEVTVEVVQKYVPTDYCLTTTFQTYSDGRVHFNQPTGDDNPCVYIDYGDGTKGESMTHTYESIGDYVVKFYFNNPITEIAPSAFFYRNLKEITIPSTVCRLGSMSLASPVLQDVEFESESQLKVIEHGAFSYTGLRSIRLPQSVETIGDCVFGGSENLESIYGGGKGFVSEIVMFTQRTAGTTEARVIAYPSGADLEELEIYGMTYKLGWGAFAYFDILKRVKMWITEIAQHNFLYTQSLEYVDLSRTIRIENNVFNDCDALTSLSFPVLSEIGVHSVCNNQSLRTLEFQSEYLSTLESIGNECPALEMIRIPSGVTSISRSFNGNPNIASVYISALTPPALTESFDSISESTCFYVPYSEADAYRTADGWKDLSASFIPYDYQNKRVWYE